MSRLYVRARHLYEWRIYDVGIVYGPVTDEQVRVLGGASDFQEFDRYYLIPIWPR